MAQTWHAAIETPDGTELWQVAGDDATRVANGKPDVTISDATAAQTFPCDLKGSAPLHQTSPQGHLPARARLMTLGAVADSLNWDGIVLVLLPDSAHWTHVSAGEAISTLGTLTPALARQLGAEGHLDQSAMDEVMTRPERLTAALFARPDMALSHLVGADLAAAKRWWLGQQIRVVGDGALAQAFVDALMTQGAPVMQIGREAATSRGLVSLAH